ncbi:MAG: outer membrane protein transport protein [Verrucomicrobiae bacterium]|nr:outer membrane protein transport protein [Verrucomicrobiae bacterium]
MIKGKRAALFLATWYCVGWVGQPSASALGFRNPDQGAAATAQGEAFIAQADDASAAYYNPAGLAQLNGTEVAAGSYLLFRDVQFRAPSGRDNMSKFDFLPHLYAASDFGLERWRFGLAVNVPYGLSVDWGRSGPFAYLVTEANLMVVNLAPVVAYRLTDELSLGAGLNIYYGDVFQKFEYSPLIPGSRFRFDGDGVGVGATVGLRWQPHRQHALALVYRSPFRIELDGRARTVNAGTLTTAASASATFQFPQSLAVGYAFWPNPKLKLETNIEWTNWDLLNTVRLRSTNAIIIGDPRSTVPFHWEDSFFYEFGLQDRVTDEWVLRGGYIFSENSVPDRTFGPLVPDSDRHVFSIGVGFEHNRLSLDVAYQYSLSEDRTVPSTNPIGAAGRWESDAHAIILTGTIRF